MQLTVDLVDWHWAKSAPTPEHFLMVMLEQDDADDQFGTSCYDFPNGWSDSARTYFAFCEVTPTVLDTLQSSEQATFFTNSLAPLFSHPQDIDELGLRPFIGECYIASLSPQTVTTLAHACRSLDLNHLAQIFDLHLPAHFFQDANRPQHIQTYLHQWITALQTAVTENKALLIHCG